MALEVTYWTARSDNKSAPLEMLSSEQVDHSAGEAKSGATPDTAVFLSVAATAAARIRYGTVYGRSPTAADTGASAYIASGERLWLTAQAGHKLSGITAA